LRKHTLRLEYCTSCNYLPRALWIAAELLPSLQHEIESFVLVPGDRGIFDVSIGDRKAYSKGATGRFPDPDELRQTIFELMESAQ
jgi:selenoprotein W-related protein